MQEILNNDEISFIKNLVFDAGILAKKIQKDGLDVKHKEDTSIVTQADYAVQEMLIDSIKEKFPHFNFIHEEDFDTSENNITEDTITAIIDPIDGTAMFSMHLPIWCVSLGIYKGYKPVYGFVYSPGAEMFFYNDEDHAYLNDEIIKVEKKFSITKESNIFYASEIQNVINIKFPGKIRNLGSTALHACLTTDNRRNRVIAFIGKSFLWDWAGAVPIILKAGGNIRYLNGKEIDVQEIINSGHKLDEFLIAYNIDDFSEIQQIFQRV